MHPRKVIRDAFVSRLTGATDAGTRVTSSRVDPYRTADLPALSVYTTSETKDDDNTTQQVLWRDLEIEVVGWVVDHDANPAADQLDALALSIEATMDVDIYLGGAIGGDGLMLQSTEMVIVAEMDGRRFDIPRGLIKLTYSVQYETNRYQPAIVTNFSRAGVTTQIAGASADNVISDLITEPT